VSRHARCGSVLVVTDARGSFAPSLASATGARRFTEQVLDGWHLDDVRDVVRLLVSELVINAVLHARTAITLCLHHESGRLRVEVSDGSTMPPVLHTPGPTAPTGRGLQIVASLSDEWGVDVQREGKTVWFVVRSGPGPGAGGAEEAGADLAGAGDDEGSDAAVDLSEPRR
jgi:anti-sigma regulatory factor (Ser/Thr protein kinase)